LGKRLPWKQGLGSGEVKMSVPDWPGNWDIVEQYFRALAAGQVVLAPQLSSCVIQPVILLL
jgi:hypothetical protein